MKKYFLILIALLTFICNLEAQKRYSIGDYYCQDGKRGVVFSVNIDGTHGKAISINECICPWENGCSYEDIGAHSTSNGNSNSFIIKNYINNTGCNPNKYPAHTFCVLLGGYLPSLDEVKEIFKNKQAINKTLYERREQLIKGKMWTSTEEDAVRAYHVYMDSGTEYASEKLEDDRRARAVFEF